MTRGQALVEFALVLPLLLLVIVGGLGLGLTLVQRLQLEHAAAELATFAASTGCAEALNRADDLLSPSVTLVRCEATPELVTFTVGQAWRAIDPFSPEWIVVQSQAIPR